MTNRGGGRRPLSSAFCRSRRLFPHPRARLFALTLLPSIPSLVWLCPGTGVQRRKATPIRSRRSPPFPLAVPCRSLFTFILPLVTWLFSLSLLHLSLTSAVGLLGAFIVASSAPARKAAVRPFQCRCSSPVLCLSRAPLPSCPSCFFVPLPLPSSPPRPVSVSGVSGQLPLSSPSSSSLIHILLRA